MLMLSAADIGSQAWGSNRNGEQRIRRWEETGKTRADWLRFPEAVSPGNYLAGVVVVVSAFFFFFLLSIFFVVSVVS
jgi:hypothetical protein